MAFQSKRKESENPKLDMTPMIDVVFQLLIFFVVTLKQEDILSKLSAARPAADPNATKENQVEPMTITVAVDGFIFNGIPMRPDALDRKLAQMAKYSKTATVLIKCTMNSPHGLLIQALDLCNKHQLSNLSIFNI